MEQRVKDIDTLPLGGRQQSRSWMALAYFTGHVGVWNYTTHAMIRQWKVSATAMRAVKFQNSPNNDDDAVWLVTAGTATHIYVLDVSSGKFVHNWKEHNNFIRGQDVQPHCSPHHLVSRSDDFTTQTLELFDRSGGPLQAYLHYRSRLGDEYS